MVFVWVYHRSTLQHELSNGKQPSLAIVVSPFSKDHDHLTVSRVYSNGRAVVVCGLVCLKR